MKKLFYIMPGALDALNYDRSACMLRHKRKLLDETKRLES